MNTGATPDGHGCWGDGGRSFCIHCVPCGQLAALRSTVALHRTKVHLKAREVDGQRTVRTCLQWPGQKSGCALRFAGLGAGLHPHLWVRCCTPAISDFRPSRFNHSEHMLVKMTVRVPFKKLHSKLGHPSFLGHMNITLL